MITRSPAQLRVGQGASIAGLAFEDDGGLVGPLGQMSIDAVPGYVEQAVVEPAEVGGLAVVENARERATPGDLTSGVLGPEAGMVPLRGLIELAQFLLADSRRGPECRRGWKLPILVQDRVDVAHLNSPL
jgi:hypothetical protein